MNCQHHPNIQAQYICERCKNAFCEQCVNIKKFAEAFTAYICKECGGKCDPIVKDKAVFKSKAQYKETKIIRTDTKKEEKVVKRIEKKTKSPDMPQFYSRLPSLLIFPFKGFGIFYLLFFTGFLYGLALLHRLIGPASAAINVIAATFFTVYLFKLIEETSAGSLRLQGFGDLNYWVSTAHSSIVIALGLLICFGPSQIYFLLSRRLDYFFVFLVFWGLFFWPMILTRVALKRNFTALWPDEIIKGIFRNLAAYLTMGLIHAVLFFIIVILSNDLLAEEDPAIQFLRYLCIIVFFIWGVRLVGLFARFVYCKNKMKTLK